MTTETKSREIDIPWYTCRNVPDLAVNSGFTLNRYTGTPGMHQATWQVHGCLMHLQTWGSSIADSCNSRAWFFLGCMRNQGNVMVVVYVHNKGEMWEGLNLSRRTVWAATTTITAAATKTTATTTTTRRRRRRRRRRTTKTIRMTTTTTTTTTTTASYNAAADEDIKNTDNINNSHDNNTDIMTAMTTWGQQGQRWQWITHCNCYPQLEAGFQQ